MKQRTMWTLAAVAVAVALVGGIAVLTREPATDSSSAQAGQVATANVERGDLLQVISTSGTLRYSANPDGSPYVAINHASGTYTKLPQNGDAVRCGQVLYRVDQIPVLMLCGTTPAYRDLALGDTGADVAQLNANLHRLGYDKATGVHIQPNDREFTSKTQQALVKLQNDKGQDATGTLARGDAVVLRSAIRVASVAGQLGGPAAPGAPVVHATSATLVVQVTLDPSQRSELSKGAAALITLPGGTSATGKVTQVGTVAGVTAGSQADAASAAILVTVKLDDPAKTSGLEEAPVKAQITTAGVKNALSVPVLALVGTPGGGYAVDVVRADGSRHLVAVTLGLFDDASGRVQVEGDLSPGDSVVIPS